VGIGRKDANKIDPLPFLNVGGKTSKYGLLIGGNLGFINFADI
jgi:hypothetical protein